MTLKSISTSLFLFSLVAATALAQPASAGRAGTAASPGPPMRVLGPALAATTEALGNVAQVRALPDGRVLVNDGLRRRVILMDSMMTVIKVVADSSPLSPNPYGPRPLRMLPYYGDSTMLLDGGSLSMLIVDGNGDIVKVKAIPRTEHSTYLASTSVTYGIPGFDAKGRLVYKVNDPVRMVTVAAGGGLLVPEQPDSSPILRMDLVTRKLDTVGRIKLQKRMTEPYSMDGYTYTRTLTNPLPVQDDWAVAADGSVAFLRHRDYSIDWLNTDGTWTSSPPMPFDWQRMTDDHKKAFADSVQSVMQASWQNLMARYDSINATCFRTARTIFPAPGTNAAGLPITPAPAAAPSPATVPPPAPPGAAAPAVNPCPTTPYLPLADWVGPAGKAVPASFLPDYKPPYSAPGAMRSDADNNLWIRVNQMKPVPGTYHYDIVNRQGELFDRIQVPIARALVGFGPGNIVYVTSRSGTPPALKLERVRWR